MVPVFPADVARKPPRRLARCRVDHAFEHIEREVGDGFGHDPFGVREEPLLEAPVAVVDLGNEIGLRDFAEIGNSRIGADEIDQADAERPEGQRRVGVEFGADAEPARSVHHRFTPASCCSLTADSVVAEFEGLAASVVMP